MKIARSLVVLLVVQACVFAQQDKSQRPSPPGTAQVSLNGKQVSVDYSRPKIADPKTGQARKVMGGLVPYGQVWRAGANEATALKTDADLEINGTRVPAGTYTLFTIPQEDKWTLIVSKKTGEWGTPYPGEKDDFARIPMNNVEHVQETVDPFTITLSSTGSSSGQLCLAWENTRSCANLTVK